MRPNLSAVKKTIQFHSVLNPVLWKNDELLIDARIRLMRTSLLFIKFLEMPELKIKDIIITGSNASYNYSAFSDVDAHLVVDFDANICPDLSDNFFGSKCFLWKLSHDIQIEGYPVEMYVQDTHDELVANGVYSLIQNKWLKRPEKRTPSVDDKAVATKTSKIAKLIDAVLSHDPVDIDKAMNIANSIRRMRKAGLEKDGEFSVENLAYKALRSFGYIKKLYDMIDGAKDESISS
jgi:hypothetical protein